MPERDYEMRRHAETTDLHPGAKINIPADLEWLNTPGPHPRRLILEPHHAAQILEALRQAKGETND